MTSTSPLLRSLSETLGRPVSWTDVVILRNVGDPNPDRPIPDSIETRGLHALVLAPGGESSHYVKLRSPGDVHARREAAVLEALRAAPLLAHLVPTCQTFELPNVTALVLGVVQGTSFSRRVGRATLAQTIADSRTCLSERRRLLDGAVGLGIAEPPALSLNTVQSIEPSLRVLEAGWLDALTVEFVRDRLSGAIPTAPQHGDFTPTNVIWSRTGPVFLDFEYLGVVNCPLYDVWHFIRNARNDRRDNEGWLGTAKPRSRRDRAWRELLDEEAAKFNLSDRQLTATLLWYLAHFTARFISRGNPETYYRPYLEDLRGAVSLLRAARQGA